MSSSFGMVMIAERAALCEFEWARCTLRVGVEKEREEGTNEVSYCRADI